MNSRHRCLSRLLPPLQLAFLSSAGLGHDTGPAGPAGVLPAFENPPAATQSANIRLVGHLDPFPGNQRYADVWGDGNFAYLGSFVDETVAIIDISTASRPKLAGTYRGLPGVVSMFEDIQVKDGIGFFASFNYSGNGNGKGTGLHIVDVSNPTSPVLLKRLTSADQGFDTIHNVFLHGHHIYMADANTATVKVFDVEVPSTPRFIRDIKTTDTRLIHDITVLNDRLYTSGWSGTTDIFDVSRIHQETPLRLGTLPSGLGTHSSWAASDGGILATCSEDGAKDLRLYNITDPRAPVLLSKSNSSAWKLDAVTPHNPVIVGHLLFVSWYHAGLQVFNIIDPTRPLLVGSFDTFAGGVSAPGGLGGFDGCWGVYPLLGLDRILLSDWDGGLFIVDATKLGGRMLTRTACPMPGRRRMAWTQTTLSMPWRTQTETA